MTIRVVIECRECDATWESDPQWRNSLTTMQTFREFAGAAGWRSDGKPFVTLDYCPDCSALIFGGAA